MSRVAQKISYIYGLCTYIQYMHIYILYTGGQKNAPSGFLTIESQQKGLKNFFSEASPSFRNRLQKIQIMICSILLIFLNLLSHHLWLTNGYSKLPPLPLRLCRPCLHSGVEGTFRHCKNQSWILWIPFCVEVNFSFWCPFFVEFIRSKTL